MTDSYWDYDAAIDELRRTRPVAHKEHTCNNCDVKIRLGEKYDLLVCIFEGEFRVFKYHLYSCPEELTRQGEQV